MLIITLFLKIFFDNPNLKYVIRLLGILNLKKKKCWYIKKRKKSQLAFRFLLRTVWVILQMNFNWIPY